MTQACPLCYRCFKCADSAEWPDLFQPVALARIFSSSVQPVSSCLPHSLALTPDSPGSLQPSKKYKKEKCLDGVREKKRHSLWLPWKCNCSCSGDVQICKWFFILTSLKLLGFMFVSANYTYSPALLWLNWFPVTICRFRANCWLRLGVWKCNYCTSYNISILLT